jgi:hypothetical protein
MEGRFWGLPVLKMSFSIRYCIPLSVVVVSAAVAQTAQPAPKSQPTARELFYSAGPAPDDTHSHKATKDPAGKAPKGNAGKATADAAPHGGTELPGGGRIVNASAGQPSGITYTLQKMAGNSMTDVSPDAVFHEGDRINLVVQTNYPGYLYIGNKGTSGAWTPLFPSNDIENGDNRVQAFHKYTLPPGYRIKFDRQTGVEDIFVLFSREPVSDFEKLLYTDSGGSRPAARSGDDKNPPKPISVAKADLPASVVDRLRSAYSRDLILEKVDDDKPGEHNEKAVYIVSPNGVDAHVWADIRLVHK